jgi:hypothetical protein
MFAGELQKQKAFFAAADGLALEAALVGALPLYDPSNALPHRLLGTNRRVLCFGVVFNGSGGGWWVSRLRSVPDAHSGLKESFAVMRAC